MKWAFLFPGQGAQYVGMGRDFYQAFPLVREIFDEADDCLSQNLSDLILQGPADALTQTKNSQLAIFVLSVALLRLLQQQIPTCIPQVCAGLSLGEYTALVASQRMDFVDCLQLVKARALYMQEACTSNQGTMRVVLGMEADDIEKTIRTMQTQYKVWVANLNCPGQVVIAGTPAGIEAASEILKAQGAKRVLPLDVSGAFHSGLMAEAQERLAPLIQEANFSESEIELVMNIPGNYVSSLAEIRKNLTEQVTGTVRWEQGIRAMDAAGVNRFLEIGCGKTLTGMNKKIGIPTDNLLSMEKVVDLETIAKAFEVVCNC